MKTIIAVFQFIHLISKTPGLAIFKMCSTLFVSSKLTEILQNLYKFQYISKLSQYPGQLLRLKKCTYTASFLYFLCHAFNIRKQKLHFKSSLNFHGYLDTPLGVLKTLFKVLKNSSFFREIIFLFYKLYFFIFYVISQVAVILNHIRLIVLFYNPILF